MLETLISYDSYKLTFVWKGMDKGKFCYEQMTINVIQKQHFTNWEVSSATSKNYIYLYIVVCL